MKIAILTSVSIRHRYFVNALRDCFDVTAVVYEETGYAPTDASRSGLTSEEIRIVENHFQERTRQENIYFGHAADMIHDGDGRCRVLHLAPNRLNTPETLVFLTGQASKCPGASPERPADTLVVFGTNLLKDPLLRHYRGRIINMHLGLSPHYRGTATNFFPLLNGEPEYVGATIHVIDAGIDSGPIFAHARPEIVAEDRPHTIGCKAILAGIDRMIAVLRAFEGDVIVPVPQWYEPNARLYLRKDYHPRQVVELHHKVEGGLIRDYVERAGRMERRVRLVEFPRRQSLRSQEPTIQHTVQ